MRLPRLSGKRYAALTMRTDVVLLPGLHGSTTLFDTFIALAPAWARCRAVSLPVDGSQSFDALAARIEPELQSLEGFVLFAESFSAPIAARLAASLGSKVALLVLCNPLVEAPVAVAPSLFSALVRSPLMPKWAVALAMTGGDRVLAAAMLREVRSLPSGVLHGRIAVAASAESEKLLAYLDAPLLILSGTSDRLLSHRLIVAVVQRVPFAVLAEIDAPHLAVQTAPGAVWAAITGEFNRAA